MSVRGFHLDEFLTIAEVAERMKVTERTVRRWIEAGLLRAHKIVGCVRISHRDFADFLERTRS
jgi:excisionase family DNA binding protein